MAFYINFTFEQGPGLSLWENLRGLWHIDWAAFKAPCSPWCEVDICDLVPALHPFFSLPHTNCDHPWGITPALLLYFCGGEDYSNLGDCQRPDPLFLFVNRNGESENNLGLVQRTAFLQEMTFDPVVQYWKKRLAINHCTASQWYSFYYKTNSYLWLLRISCFFWFQFSPKVLILSNFLIKSFLLISSADFCFCSQETRLWLFIHLSSW